MMKNENPLKHSQLTHRFKELLVMVDTCQAATLYSHVIFYAFVKMMILWQNILALGRVFGLFFVQNLVKASYFQHDWLDCSYIHQVYLRLEAAGRVKTHILTILMLKYVFTFLSSIVIGI